MKKIFRKLRKLYFNYKPLVQVEISKGRLMYNLKYFQNLDKQVKIAPVLKSNAYGHGLEVIAKLLDNKNLPFFVVDTFYEALVLHNEQIKTPVLIIGYTYFENIIKNKVKKVIFTISSIEQLQEIVHKLDKKRLFNLKIDTGMHRQGIKIDQIDKAISLIKTNKNLMLISVCSHFAEAECANSSLTQKQIENWEKVLVKIVDNFKSIKFIHFANSAGRLNNLKIKQNVCRIGLGLYGIDHYFKNDLQPVLSLKTIITSVKNINTNDQVGYNGAYLAKNRQKIATIPIGYYEGLNKKLSNKGLILVKNKQNVPCGTFCQILGNISMNITTIDVSKILNIKIGTQVVIISNTTKNPNSVVSISKQTQLLPYEILVQIPYKLSRVIVD